MNDVPVAYSHPTTEVDLAKARLEVAKAVRDVIQLKVEHGRMEPFELDIANAEVHAAETKLNSAKTEFRSRAVMAHEVLKVEDNSSEEEEEESSEEEEESSEEESSEEDSSDEEEESAEEEDLVRKGRIAQLSLDVKQCIRENPLHPNQHKIAENIVMTILKSNDPSIPNFRVHQQCITALTQSGKTGVIIAVISTILKQYKEGKYPTLNPDGIFVLGNISSRDWLEQTKDRMPESIKPRVFHLAEFKKKLNEVSSDAVIFVDEAHMCANPKMTFNQVMHKLGLKDYGLLCNMRIHMVYISATPMNIIQDMDDWHNDPQRVITHVMEPGENYTGIRTLMKEGRVYDNPSLYCDDNIRKLLQFIQKTYSESDARYHILRLGNYLDEDGKKKKDTGTVLLERIKAELNESDFSYDCISCDCKSASNKLLPILEKKPQRHTFVIIKSMAREAITIPKDTLGLLYESNAAMPGVHTVVQSLAGRLTGYDVTNDTHVFTNLDCIRQYLEMWQQGFEPRTLVGVRGGVTYANPQTFGESSRQAEERARKESYMRVPIVFSIEHNSSLLSSKNNRDAKISLIKTLVQKNHPEVIAFLNHARCKQVTQVKTKNSCDKKIRDSIKKHDDGKPFCIDFNDEDKMNSCWGAFIENETGRTPSDKPHHVVLMFWVLPEDAHLYP
jgi:hypothetical protein